LACPIPGNRNINGEMAGAAENPPHPAQIKEMTDASAKVFAIGPTFTTASI
jgi:hypothetical protein